MSQLTNKDRKTFQTYHSNCCYRFKSNKERFSYSKKSNNSWVSMINNIPSSGVICFYLKANNLQERFVDLAVRYFIFSAVNQYLKYIFIDNRLEDESVIKQYLITAIDKKNHKTEHCNMQDIMSVKLKIFNKQFIYLYKLVNYLITIYYNRLILIIIKDYYMNFLNIVTIISSTTEENSIIEFSRQLENINNE